MNQRGVPKACADTWGTFGHRPVRLHAMPLEASDAGHNTDWMATCLPACATTCPRATSASPITDTLSFAFAWLAIGDWWPARIQVAHTHRALQHTERPQQAADTDRQQLCQWVALVGFG